jgi:hypothetical protein
MEDFATELLSFVAWGFAWYFLLKAIKLGFQLRTAYHNAVEIEEELVDSLYSLVHKVKVEKHADTYYWFDEDNDQFFAQGQNSAELVEHLKQRFRSHVFLVDDKKLLCGPDFDVVDIEHKTPDEVGKQIADLIADRILKIEKEIKNGRANAS